jgi:hypothetical protein
MTLRLNLLNGLGFPVYFGLILGPSEKPVITSARNASSTSIHMEWTPPPLVSINGEFLGYKVTYSETAAGSSSYEPSPPPSGPSAEGVAGYDVEEPTGQLHGIMASGEVEIRDPNITVSVFLFSSGFIPDLECSR